MRPSSLFNRTNIVHMTASVSRRLNIYKCNVSCLSTPCCIEVPVSNQEVHDHAHLSVRRIEFASCYDFDIRFDWQTDKLTNDFNVLMKRVEGWWPKIQCIITYIKPWITTQYRPCQFYYRKLFLQHAPYTQCHHGLRRGYY